MNDSLELRIDRRVLDRLRAFHLAPGKAVESLSYIWARCEIGPNGHRVLIPANAPVFLLGPDCYERQSSGQVRLHSDVLNGMLVQFAASPFNCLVNCHDHPTGLKVFSGTDDRDDLAFDRYLRVPFARSLLRMGNEREVFNCSLLLTGELLEGRLTDVRWGEPFCNLRRAFVIGAQPEVISPGVDEPPARDERLVRHASFIDARSQAIIAGLHIGIVGCGGLGSVLAESCLRLGFRHFTLVDGDTLAASNLNRWQGGRPIDVGRHKAELIAQRLLQYQPGIAVTAVNKALDTPDSLESLRQVDVLIGGVDDDVARYQLNHLALTELIPWFDAGVGISTKSCVDFRGRYFSVLPGLTSCAECKSFDVLDSDAIAYRLAHPSTRRERQRAGYVVDQPDVAAPSAYALNQRTASVLMQEFLNWITGWRPLATFVGESWQTGSIQRADAANFVDAPSDYCPSCALLLGQGSAARFPQEISGDICVPEVLSRAINGSSVHR